MLTISRKEGKRIINAQFYSNAHENMRSSPVVPAGTDAHEGNAITVSGIHVRPES